MSGTASTQNLHDALIRAYETNPRIASARAELRTSDEDVIQAEANWRPTLVIDGSAGASYENSTTTADSKTGLTTYPRMGSVSISQNLYRGGRIQAETRQAKNLVLRDRARLSSVEQDVLTDAVTAYMDVVRDRAVIELNEHNERVLQRQLEATRDRFRVGEVTRTDVAQAESRVSRGTADLARARGALIESRANFINVIGIAPAKLDSARPLSALPANEADAIEQAKKRSFDLLAADYDERAAREFVKVVSGELLPVVGLSISAARAYDGRSRQSESDSLSATATLRVPLYQAGGVSSRIREAKHDVARLRSDRNQALRDAIDTATSSWEDYATARAQINAFSEEVRAATIALEGVEQEALVGSRTVLDVLDAEQELLDGRVNLVRARRDLVVATYTLRSAVGQLTARSLGLSVKYYDPGKNYRAFRRRWFGTRINE